MGTRWQRYGWLTVMLLGLAGCKSPQITPTKPQRQEEWVLPPDHPKFSQPIAYPGDLLNKGSGLKRDNSNAIPPPMTGMAGRPGGAGAGSVGGPLY